ncbi:MAG: hypothetical protein Q8N30_04690 [Methylococcales bacterium]|nr:hypothetical protein [Methylococcales bacterium]
MKKYFYMMSVIGLLMSNLVMAESEKEPPVQIGTRQQHGYKVITVTSMVDAITIEDIIVNRGNCSLEGFRGSLPAKLKFGEIFTIPLPLSCSAIEIIANTDKGKWFFSKK